MSVLTRPAGYRTSGVYVGIKRKGKDVGLIFSEVPASAAGMFTLNHVRGAAVDLCRRHLADGRLSAIVVSSGVSNVCTGAEGERNALAMAQAVAAGLAIPPEDVAVATTGIIGAQLPMEKIRKGIELALAELGEDEHGYIADAILTTDTCRKESYRKLQIGGKTVTLAGIAKGAGMVHPNLGTTFAFVTSDAAVPAELLRGCLREAVERSFNVMSVDGDQSTSDSVIVMANGAAGHAPIAAGSPEHGAFCEALGWVLQDLARQLVVDGEGATRFLSIHVTGARSYEEAKAIARHVSTSCLVKTALFGGDPNWGRIMARVGSAGIPVRQEKISLAIGNLPVIEAGQPLPYDKKVAAEQVAGAEVEFTVNLGLGSACCTAYTCDLTYDYVKINAEYHT